jgi:hypothetical protein
VTRLTLAIISIVVLSPFFLAQAERDIPAPFGFKMGASRDEVAKDAEEMGSFEFGLRSAPRPDPDFTIYFLTITPKAGVCGVTAVTGYFKTNVDGTEIRSRFQRLQSQLNDIYGTSKTIDRIKIGSTLNKPKYWTMALQKHDRIFGATWDAESGALLQPSIISIRLIASAKDSETGLIQLEYDFANKPVCNAEINQE